MAAGKPDIDVLAFATANTLIVLTEDTDFGDLVVRQHLPTAGVVLLRLSGMDRTAQPDYMAQILTTQAQTIPGTFTVITPTSTRIRVLP